MEQTSTKMKRSEPNTTSHNEASGESNEGLDGITTIQNCKEAKEKEEQIARGRVERLMENTSSLLLIADKVAAAGYYALSPDFFHGEPFNPNNTQRPKDAWLKDHTPEKGFDDAETLLADLKSRGMSKVGFAGFYWGGAVASKIAKFNDSVSAVVLLHPSHLIVDEIKEIRAPIEIMAAALDKATATPIVNQYKQIFAANHIDSRLKTNPNVSHGWTLRYYDSIPFVVKSAFKAHADMLSWFNKHMK